jgi:hypothetical protein
MSRADSEQARIEKMPSPRTFFRCGYATMRVSRLPVERLAIIGRRLSFQLWQDSGRRESDPGHRNGQRHSHVS